MKKPRLILLSDLWGTKSSEWICNCTSALNKHFDINIYNSPELAGIDTTDLDQKQSHQWFLNGSIEKAVLNLLESERQNINVLGFSVGGKIAWKAALKGLNVHTLFAVSATRLRLEAEKPNSRIELLFGQCDSNKPGEDWFAAMEIKKLFVKGEQHEMYKNKQVAHLICSQIISKVVVVWKV